MTKKYKCGHIGVNFTGSSVEDCAARLTSCPECRAEYQFNWYMSHDPANPKRAIERWRIAYSDQYTSRFTGH